MKKALGDVPEGLSPDPHRARSRLEKNVCVSVFRATRPEAIFCANARKAASRLPRCYFFFFAAFFFAGAFFFALPFFAAIPYPPLGSPLAAGLQPFPGENRHPSTTSTEAGYRGASVQESRDDRCFGTIFLKPSPVTTAEIAAQNAVPVVQVCI
jgi:hypothetical protein